MILIYSFTVIPGVFYGVLAVGQLVQQNWHLPGMLAVTCAYGSLAIGQAVGMIVLFYFGRGGRRHLYSSILIVVAVPLTVICYLMVAYSNWVIAISVHNIGGFPGAIPALEKALGAMHFIGTFVEGMVGFAGFFGGF